jgi:DNA-binding response OmpR family regulator
MKPRILIVDDDEHLLLLLTCAFEDENYELVLARGGQEALDLIHAERPDLILLDLSMPVVSGYDVMRAIKEDGSTRDIPVIIITSRDLERDMLDGFELGASDYITKPFSLAHLIARVKTWLFRSGFYKKTNQE